ncbi:MAG: hypothetical protein JKY89_10935 [Immundisolibacteraceae bacterium]|nr:hypothetical protein [Immundisolibacteraceae bacterium]
MASNFNPVASFSQGQQAGQALQQQQRQQQINALQQGIAQQAGQGAFSPSQSLDFQELTALDPQRAGQVASTFRGLSKDRQKAYFDDVVSARNMVANNNMQGAIDLFTDRRSAIVNLNGDTSGTDAVLTKMASGDSAGVLRGLDSAKEAGVQLGFLKDTEAEAIKRKTAGEREFESLTGGLTDDQKKEATLIKLGLSPRAVGSAIQTISDQGLADQIGKVKATIKQREKFGELTATRRSKVIDNGFSKIEKINAGILNIDRAITVLNSGAGVGAIQKFLPSFKASSVELDNIQKSMALDVIGSVTFGALSEGELNLAKEVALPTGLDTPQLIDHLNRRKSAQEKLRSYYSEQINFLDQGGTVAGFLRSKEREQDQPPAVNDQPGEFSGFKVIR